MRKFAVGLAAGAAMSMLVLPASGAAQDAAEPATAPSEDDDAEADASPELEEFDQAMAMMGTMFPVEPLSADQKARLPQAQRIITRMIPEGAMGEMMGAMFDKMLGPIMAVTDAPAMTAVSQGTGIGAEALDLAPAQAAEIAALFDPAYAERHQREAAMFPDMLRDMMTVMEPGMRKAMSELYAINFSQAELDGIEAFFQTDIGTAYARKSFTMSSDPRVMSATMESMPQLMSAFGDIEARLAAASEGLPPKRSFADLAPAEQARVAELTGYGIEEIEAHQAIVGAE